MRYLRAAVVLALATAALALPSSAFAQIQSLSVSDATLGPEGGSLLLTMTYQCDIGFFAAGYVEVLQARGKNLVRGSGSLPASFPGVPCTGNPETHEVLVGNGSDVPYQHGKAAATVSLQLLDPETGNLVFQTNAPQEMRIRK